MSWFSEAYRHKLSATGIRNANTNKTIAKQHIPPKQLVSDWKPHTGGLLFHGTSQQFDRFGSNVVYLTDSAKQSNMFGDKILFVHSYPGLAKDINRELYSGDVDDYDEEINRLIPLYRKQGYRYLTFNHPGHDNVDMNAIISLYPNVDLQIVKS
jgi:hypothetical protein